MSDAVQNVTNAPTEPPAAPQAQPQPSKVEPTATMPVTTGGKTFSEAEVEQLIKDRLEREKSKREQAAEQARKKAEEDAAAKNQEWQKLAETREKELADLQAQVKARDLVELKRAIAEKIGLPAALAARLVGDTEKDLETDAKALLETLPKPPAPTQPGKPQPGIAPANPGANGSQGLTPQQQRDRIYGAQSNPFDPNAARRSGGGVIFVEPKE